LADDTSIYHVFERLNTGGQKLKPQEIREAVYHGELMKLVDRLNLNPNWRSIYGKPSPRLKDSELVLRFLAFYFNSDKYQRPLGEFLNQFALKYRNPSKEFLEKCEAKFTETITIIFNAIGDKAFKPEGTLNTAVCDSVMVGVARRLDAGPIQDLEALKKFYDELLQNEQYRFGVTSGTADKENVTVRLRNASLVFSSLE
jgi:hypothetical protein